MNLATWVAIVIITGLIIFAVGYIREQKKKGNKCIGCPYADSCRGKHNSAHIYQTRF